MKLVVTIDTEEDNWARYFTTDNPVQNIERILPLQHLFDEFGIKPAYLVTYPVATNPESVVILRRISEEGKCEIGMHCHPWNTPPFEEELNDFNTMLCNLPEGLIHRKLTMLHEAIGTNFGVVPVSFRAGRWGFDTKVARTIHTLGYRIDSSVTPLVSWQLYQGPDFEFAPLENYWFEPEEPLKKADSGALFEVQPTIGYLNGDQSFCRAIRRKILNGHLSRLHLLGLLDRAGIVRLRWLSPEMSNLKDMIHLIRKAVDRGVRLLNFTFHSNSLLPGKSPFVRTAADREVFLEKIQRVLEFAALSGATFIPLSEAANRYPGSGMPAASIRSMPPSAG